MACLRAEGLTSMFKIVVYQSTEYYELLRDGWQLFRQISPTEVEMWKGN